MPQSTFHILNALRVLVQSLQIGSRSSERKVGLTGAQLFVLEKLSEADELTVNELATRTHTHQSTVSVVVSKLVEKKLVSRVRSSTDARVQLLSITKAGRAKLERTPETVQDKLLGAIQRLSQNERVQLSALLQKVMEEARLTDVAPSLFLEEQAEKKREA